MPSQPKVESTVSAMNVERTLSTAGTSAGYLTLVIGYLLGILQANHLTVVNSLAFTALQVLYCAVLWWMLRSKNGWQRVLNVGILTGITIVSGLLSATGIQFDWLLYLVMVSIYFATLPVRTAIIPTVLLYGVMGISLGFLYHWNWYSVTPQLLSFLPAFGFVAVFSLVFRILNIQRERAERLLHQLEVSNQELEQAHAKLRDYANEVEELTIVRERTRVAREIHDSLGHYLSILSIQLETISKLQERDPARAIVEVAEARRVVAQSIQEVRNAVAALRTTSIATLGLTEALTQLGREFEYSAGETRLTLDLDTQVPPISSDLQVALYRAAQEALTNVRKHANATKVLVRLRYEDEVLELVVLDNGNGTATNGSKESSGGFGLIGLHERIKLLGGEVTHGPAEPSGYRVTVRVPVPSVRLGHK